MTERILQKIEHIRTLPEHIRLRYAVGSVAICMIFIVGVWLLTLKQGFSTISPEVSNGKNQAEEAVSDIGRSLPATDSLRSLKENSESLRVDRQGSDAEQFINQELERISTPPNQAPQ